MTTNAPAGGGADAAQQPPRPDPSGQAAARIWRNMSQLVLERERRKEVTDALGMSFFRIKVLRRINAATEPMTLSELAAKLGSDRPYLTLTVDDLTKRGLVERQEHPTDRRSKVVSVTPAGRAAAERANAILGTPPPALRDLPAADLAALDRITASLVGPDAEQG
ncbi:MarR family winged helix-turn-helix transcriptional regulator [Streptomyces sp. CA-111067]|uniref:MarR family winged helix-turn-helix transcriptional regulator n=1 Tax=Streptomyces sp. CA-111067 TaxID=3240046 RepID=UPI003D97F5F3